MKTTLVIMAAGIGSRFGGGIKQLERMGPNGEIIMDYSIYDAKEAGFDKVVFIIRKDIEQDFKTIIGDRIASQIEVDYVFQDLADLPEGYTVPEGRTKPWGTGQAVLCCRGVVKEPFVVINADDYYGKEAFVSLHEFLVTHHEAPGCFQMGMAGYILKNTLSENGTVTRGVCVVDEQENLNRIIETTGIQQVDGRIVCDNEEVKGWITEDVNVSMNMWAAYPDFLDYLAEGFREFLGTIGENPLKKEYLLPTIVGQLLAEQKAQVKVHETQDRWFGVTYLEDKPAVVASIQKLIEDGIYPEKLWQ
ncbi:MAG: NDP-sugar synthase [Roseburia sp.]